MWYIINNNGKLYVRFRYWKKVVDNYDTRSIIKLTYGLNMVRKFLYYNSYFAF